MEGCRPCCSLEPRSKRSVAIRRPLNDAGGCGGDGTWSPGPLSALKEGEEAEGWRKRAQVGAGLGGVLGFPNAFASVIFFMSLFSVGRWVMAICWPPVFSGGLTLLFSIPFV